MEFESMAEMAKRLAGTSGGAQANAVIQAIKAINSAPGMLDEINRAVAIYHIAVALSGESNTSNTIENLAYILNNNNEF